MFNFKFIDSFFHPSRLKEGLGFFPLSVDTGACDCFKPQRTQQYVHVQWPEIILSIITIYHPASKQIYL